MQMANSTNGGDGLESGIRTAVQQDAGAIMRLLQTAELGHIHVDWRLPGEWLGEPAFFVHEASSGQRRSKLLGEPRPQIDAVLCVAADPPPASWVRISGLRNSEDLSLMAEMIRIAIDTLPPEVNEIAWFVTDSWPYAWLRQLGFRKADDVMTYRKNDFSIPRLDAPSALQIRPVREEEMPLLAEIEATAFAPRWRHSAEALAMAWKQSLSFDVAEVGDRLIGFQFSTHGPYSAHLARMTVHPDWQGQGVGGALLAEALASYQAAGAVYATLNTQRANEPSRKLYTRFGFEPTGQEFPVWSLPLSASLER